MYLVLNLGVALNNVADQISSSLVVLWTITYQCLKYLMNWSALLQFHINL